MSDTPETDAHDEAWQYNMQYDTFSALMDDPIPWDEFARKLERERDEAIIKYTGQANEYEKQRNTALAQLEKARKQLAEIEQKVSLQLGGHPNSKLWGEAGLIAATMRCVDALDEVTEQRDRLAEVLLALRNNESFSIGGAAYETIEQALQSLHPNANPTNQND